MLLEEKTGMEFCRRYGRIMVVLLGFWAAFVCFPCRAQQQVMAGQDAGKDMVQLEVENPVVGDVADMAPLSLDAAKNGVSPRDIPSLFFTFWQHETIRGAKRARGVGVARPPAEGELDALSQEQMPKPLPEEREIRLAGIVYAGKGDWTIWLNGKRITPDAVPKEVMELQVFKEYIDVKWFDEYTNKIFPVRLRPHQRFNMDTLIFLPG